MLVLTIPPSFEAAAAVARHEADDRSFAVESTSSFTPGKARLRLTDYFAAVANDLGSFGK